MIEKIFLLTISGENKPGMCTQITSVLANNDAEILDIGQAVIHDTLSLGLLIGISENKDITKLVSTIELALNHCDIRIKTVEISEQDYSHWVAGRGKPKHVIT
ncbi:MAG: ACT domain-containing protein, partial [Pseudomonadales bacterium]